MTVSGKLCSENECVEFGICDFEIVKDCTYLGTVLTNKNVLPTTL